MATKRKPPSPEAAFADACREGNWEASLEPLSALSDAGNAGASAIVTQLFAALGTWDQVVTHGARFLANPDAASTSNVFTDVTRLVRRALVDELKRPAELKRIGAKVPREWHAMRDATLLADPFAEDEPANRAAYESAVEQAPRMPRFKRRPHELPRHLFALAAVFHVDDAIIARWKDDAPWGFWDGAMDVARALVRAKKPERAWKTLSRWFRDWPPVDPLQVFPSDVLVDRHLRTLMTPKRCRAVLDRA